MNNPGKKRKQKTKRNTTLKTKDVHHSSLVAVYQEHQRKDVVFHNSYVSLELVVGTMIFRTELKSMPPTIDSATLLDKWPLFR
jgi:hypothetical protein